MASEERFLEEFLDFLTIPSISTLPEHAPDVRRAASWVKERLERIGFRTTLVETPGHPVVYGEHLADPELPTVVYYGHYDVQPVDPLEEWQTPPFVPDVRDGFVYARGASDDKGQVLVNLQAFELLAAEGTPFNVLAVIEGEEEIGSPHLPEVLDRYLAELGRAGVAFVSDTTMFAQGVPSLCTGLRGLADCEIIVTGPKHDLHSGLYGGAIQNPLHALAAILAALHDTDGRVAVPGFYDDVAPPPRWELENARQLPFDEEAFLASTGSPCLFGEPGYTTLERLWFRPTLEVNGMVGGFTGQGQKTIVPARALAKISCRLVPDQQPKAILAAIRRYVEAIAPPGVLVTVEERGGSPAVVVPTDLEALRMVAEALTESFGRQPVFVRMGGSIPVVSLFQELLGLPTLMVGFALPDDGFHSPNEHFSLENLTQGRQAVYRFYRKLAGRG